MQNSFSSYEFIESKINQIKETYPSLRDKTNDYVFSVLCVKSNFYKNPALPFNEQIISEMVVDGTRDGGVDVLLTDPNSDESNLVLIQSKFYNKISYEDIINAINKMVSFYKDMDEGKYSQVKDEVSKRFLNLNAEVGDESKVIFVIYTSANKGGIRRDRIEKSFNALLHNNINKFELRVLYADDICEEIKEAESRRPTVESGRIHIDKAKNYLEYLDEAIIVNVSAFCIKELYAKYDLCLLAKNLRYHVSGNIIDRAIRESVRDNPEDFWFKNNGLTIICDDFELSGKEVKLKNFSIINGGQTTFNLYKSTELDKYSDFYLPCKIIRIKGETEDEKNTFSLEIAKATNSQKAIKPVDLKANAPEQVRFANTMRSNGIFYQTKRGEDIPKDYKIEYKNTDLSEAGKLCLAGIFQMPGSSRNRPSVIYSNEFYEPIFNGNQDKIAKLVRELLYIDYYFKNSFLKKFDKENENKASAPELIPFAHNSRTICVAFAAFASRYKSHNLDDAKVKIIFENISDNSNNSKLYDIFSDIDSINTFFPVSLYKNKDKFDEILYKLFETIIKCGKTSYSYAKEKDNSLNESNYLKKDFNYYNILKKEWDNIVEKINEILDSIE